MTPYLAQWMCGCECDGWFLSKTIIKQKQEFVKKLTCKGFRQRKMNRNSGFEIKKQQ
jgi:hypothetical protein